jgi:ATP-binding cassette subfamily F protein 3
VLALKGLDFAYGETPVYQGLDFEIERGQRMVLVGPNGAGKSTLLKLLAGALKPQGGKHELGHNVKLGYFAQYRGDVLNMRHTVLQSAMDLPSRPGENLCRTLLGSFLFHGDDVFKPVGVLSGGEKSRLALVRLLLDPPNLLLMDEPTTHLDMGSIDALIGALEDYEGTLVFISHDVHFIRAMAKGVIHIAGGVLTPYAGDYQYYLDKTKAGSAREALTANLTNYQPGVAAAPAKREFTPPKSKEQRRLEAEARNAKSKTKKGVEERIARIEAELAKLEARKLEIVALLQDGETYADAVKFRALSEELEQIEPSVAKQTSAWEKATEDLEAFAGQD